MKISSWPYFDENQIEVTNILRSGKNSWTGNDKFLGRIRFGQTNME